MAETTSGDDRFGPFLFGTLLAGTVAVAHNTAKDQQHQLEISQWARQCAANYKAYIEAKARHDNLQKLLQETTAKFDLYRAREQTAAADAARLTAERDKALEQAEKAERRAAELEREQSLRESLNAGPHLPTDPPGNAKDYPFSKN